MASGHKPYTPVYVLTAPKHKERADGGASGASDTSVKKHKGSSGSSGSAGGGGLTYEEESQRITAEASERKKAAGGAIRAIKRLLSNYEADPAVMTVISLHRRLELDADAQRKSVQHAKKFNDNVTQPWTDADRLDVLVSSVESSAKQRWQPTVSMFRRLLAQLNDEQNDSMMRYLRTNNELRLYNELLQRRGGAAEAADASASASSGSASGSGSAAAGAAPAAAAGADAGDVKRGSVGVGAGAGAVVATPMYDLLVKQLDDKAAKRHAAFSEAIRMLKRDPNYESDPATVAMITLYEYVGLDALNERSSLRDITEALDEAGMTSDEARLEELVSRSQRVVANHQKVTAARFSLLLPKLNAARVDAMMEFLRANEPALYVAIQRARANEPALYVAIQRQSKPSAAVPPPPAASPAAAVAESGAGSGGGGSGSAGGSSGAKGPSGSGETFEAAVKRIQNQILKWQTKAQVSSDMLGEVDDDVIDDSTQTVLVSIYEDYDRLAEGQLLDLEGIARTRRKNKTMSDAAKRTSLISMMKDNFENTKAAAKDRRIVALGQLTKKRIAALLRYLRKYDNVLYTELKEILAADRAKSAAAAPSASSVAPSAAASGSGSGSSSGSGSGAGVGAAAAADVKAPVAASEDVQRNALEFRVYLFRALDTLDDSPGGALEQVIAYWERTDRALAAPIKQLVAMKEAIGRSIVAANAGANIPLL